MTNNERHRLRLRPPPGETIPKWSMNGMDRIRYAETVCGLAVSRNISPAELLDWHFGDLDLQHSKHIEDIFDPQWLRGLLGVLGYYSRNGKSPRHEAGITEAELVESLLSHPACSFFREFKSLLADKQHPSPESSNGKLGPRRRVVGNWPGEGGHSRF